MTLLSPPSGSATLTAIAVFENPRHSDVEKGSKILNFDTHIYCRDDKDSGTTGILASLRYFNHRDLSFDDVGAYFIIANVVKVQSEGNDLPNIASEELKNDDYCLVGDIISLMPASLDDVENPPFIQATGYLTSVTKDEQSHTLTFELAPEQYTHVYREYNKKAGVKKSSLPIRCIIKESPRWTWKSLPNLQVGHIVHVSGFLSSVLRHDDKKTIRAFELDSMEQVIILGRTTVAVHHPEPSSSAPLKRKQGLQFSFGSSNPALKKARLSVEEKDAPSSTAQAQ